MKTAVAAALLLLLADPGAWAQTTADQLHLNREQIETRRRFIVGGSLPLSEGEAKAFWPLFEEYQEQRRKLDQRADKLVVDYVAAYASLTDARARELLDEMLRLDEEQLALRRRWVERMSRALPARKLARYFQIENKLQAVARAELAQQIPLVP